MYLFRANVDFTLNVRRTNFNIKWERTIYRITTPNVKAQIKDHSRNVYYIGLGHLFKKDTLIYLKNFIKK